MNSKAIRNCSLPKEQFVQRDCESDSSDYLTKPVKDIEPVDVLRAHLGDEARLLEEIFRRPRQENDRQR